MASKDGSPGTRERNAGPSGVVYSGTGVSFDRKIKEPYPIKIGDPHRWLTDKLERPHLGRLDCSHVGCHKTHFIAAQNWYQKSYLEFRSGNTVMLAVTRVFIDRWVFLRIYDLYYSFCPEHNRFWKGLNLADTILGILKLDRGQIITSPERDDLIRLATLFDYQRDEFVTLVNNRLLQ